MNRKDLILGSALLALPVFFLSDAIFLNRTFFMRDLIYLFHPWRELAAQMIQAGNFPAWNSYAMGGMPFLANCQSAILYPLSLIFWIFHFPAALKLFHLLHYGLAGLGFYIFARKARFNIGVSMMGSFVFALNGYMLTRLEFLSVLGSLIWFPWIAIFAVPRAGKPSNLYLTGLCLGLTLAFLAGYPQIFLLAALAAFFLSLAASPWKGAITLWLKGSFIFALLAAAQIVPTLELMRRSVRSNGVPFSEAVSYSLPIDGLFGLIYPFRILHHPDRFTGEKYFWIWSGWWGIVATLLIIFGFALKKQNRWIFPTALGLIGIVWSMGDHLPFFEFLYSRLPIIRLFRYPPVALYWTVIGVACLVLWAGRSVSASAYLSPRIKNTMIGIAALSILIELQFYSRGILPTVPNHFYHASFKAVRASQEGNGTAMLSPKLNTVRRLPGMTEDFAKLSFRGYLFDLTNLPYRIKTIIPSGEPLSLASYHRLYSKLGASGSLEEARQLLNLWNVTHFLTEETLDSSWTQIETDRDIKVYRNSKALGYSFAMDGLTRPRNEAIKNDRFAARYEADQNLNIVFNIPNYPGWKIYSAADSSRPIRLDTFKVQDYFIGAAIRKGAHAVYAVYHSTAVQAGILASILGTALLCGLGLIRLKAHV